VTIFVGSTNPVKVNAVTTAASETWPEVMVHSIDVPSGINDQPIGDQETSQGARNRAQAALEDGITQLQSDRPDSQPPNTLGVGLEGGVFHHQGGLWSTVWVAVTDTQGNIFEANGARFKVPDLIADLIKEGKEMGPVVERLVGEADVRSKQGMIGVITNNFVDRTEEYTGITKMALGLWYGRDWAAGLQ
jgi:inosine/xanthosine triphosphatase